MKQHNLYRLVITAYIGGGLFLGLTFACVFTAIMFGGGPIGNLAWLFGIPGTLAVAVGACAHMFAHDMYTDLKPLPREQRRRIEREALNRRADAELDRAIAESKARTRAIEGKVWQ